MLAMINGDADDGFTDKQTQGMGTEHAANAEIQQGGHDLWNRWTSPW
jgi:hypothetical protein